MWAIVPTSLLRRCDTLQDVYEGSLARTSFALVMLAVAAGMALLLGSVGMYGVLAYAVTQRTREIGIRAALGAEQRALRATFVRDGVILACIGVILGVPVALVLTRLMDVLLFGVTRMDPVTYLTVSIAMIGVAALASYAPARRASRIDPLVALRYE